MKSKCILCLGPNNTRKSPFDTLPEKVGDVSCTYETITGDWDSLISQVQADERKYDLVLVKLLRKDISVSKIKEFFEVLPAGLPVVAIGEYDDLILYRNLRALGFCDYVLEPINPAVFEDIMLVSFGLAQPLSRIALTSRGKKIAIIGARGGVGTSTICANLATVLAEEYHEIVALIEISFMKRDLSYFFGKPPNNSIYDLATQDEEVKSLPGLSVEIAKNIFLFSTTASLPLGMQEHFFDNLPHLIDITSDAHNTTIIDLSHMEHAYIIEHIAHLVDGILIVIDGSIPAITQANNIISSVSDLDKSKVQIVTNLHGAFKTGVLPRTLIEESLALPPQVYLPFDEKNGLAAINSGSLLCKSNKQFMKAIRNLIVSLGWYKEVGKRLFKKFFSS